MNREELVKFRSRVFSRLCDQVMMHPDSGDEEMAQCAAVTCLCGVHAAVSREIDACKVDSPPVGVDEDGLSDTASRDFFNSMAVGILIGVAITIAFTMAVILLGVKP